MSKIKVKSIEIQIGKNTVKLTPDEARALRDELNDVLGDGYTRYYGWPTYRATDWYNLPGYTRTITVSSSPTITAYSSEDNMLSTSCDCDSIRAGQYSP